MRWNILKKNSTKPERIFYEVLKERHVPFLHRIEICGYEVDFLLWNEVAVEIDGHRQNDEKNEVLAKAGYTPIHLHNKEINPTNIKRIIKELE